MITITGDFYIVIYSNGNYEIWSLYAVNNTRRDHIKQFPLYLEDLCSFAIILILILLFQ